jgi:transketolase
LRAIPNLLVMRPCDSIETAECWEVALQQSDRPSVIALTRQGVPTLRLDASENLSRFGAYILIPAEKQRQVTLLATGSEVSIAAEAREKLMEEGISAAVVSVPSWELFLEQPAHYRDEVLGPGTLHVAVEAATGFGWTRWTGLDGCFVGMKSFGASAPAGDLYKHFKITADEVVDQVKTWL